jgi:hypothetical protein
MGSTEWVTQTLDSCLARTGRYRPGERGWIKIKNREYWRFEIERESAIKKEAPADVRLVGGRLEAGGPEPRFRPTDRLDSGQAPRRGR